MTITPATPFISYPSLRHRYPQSQAHKPRQNPIPKFQRAKNSFSGQTPTHALRPRRANICPYERQRESLLIATCANQPPGHYKIIASIKASTLIGQCGPNENRQAACKIRPLVKRFTALIKILRSLNTRGQIAAR